jgi:hypothetical protein
VLRIEGIRFYALQKSDESGLEKSALSTKNLVDLSLCLDDFTDTAAAIGQMDLMLCVDTSVAHLAAALGKPVWLMLSKPADFRWLEDREDSPWYPTVQLFRQSRPGDWSDVVERVKSSLEHWVKQPHSTMALAASGVKVPMSTALPWRNPEQVNAGHRPGLTAVTETRVGILQYVPEEPIVGESIGWYGECLLPQLDLLARVVRRGATVMEVGAGVGAHSVPLGRMVGETGHLFVQESRPVMQEILRQNLAANGVENVTVLPSGHQDRGRASSGGAFVKATIDELGLQRLDCLKVGRSSDTLDVLAGASETLWRLRPLLFLTIPDEEALESVKDRVREFSYRCWRLETALFNAQNFNRRDEDIFSGRTELALLAIPEETNIDVSFDGCSEVS